jgi:farnesol dehydrogenase
VAGPDADSIQETLIVEAPRQNPLPNGPFSPSLVLSPTGEGSPTAPCRVLVTGATGFIGTRLVEMLSAQGQQVRALSRRRNPAPPPGFGYRDGGPLAHKNVELVLGDITDRDSLRRAMKGCTQVYHLAAFAKNWARDPQTYVDLNIQGMRNVFDVAAELGVERVVWTSTEVTLGPNRPGEIASEATPRQSERCFTDYERTKLIAEREALERGAQGFPVVIVNPCRVYGPGQLTEGNSVSRLIDQYDRGLMPFLLNGGVNLGTWVLVDDVARGHILAMQKGRIGQRYLLGGEVASLKRFLQLIDEISGRRHFRIPLFCIAPMVAACVLKKRGDWFGIHPPITPGWVRTFCHNWARTSEKAQRELGYQPTPLAEGLRITCQWLLRVRKEQR